MHDIILTTCQLVICQRINHNTATKLCDLLIPLLDNIDDYIELFEKKLGVKKTKTICDLLKIKTKDKNNQIIIEKISLIKGIGPWTIKNLKNTYLNANEFIFEDLEVRKGLNMDIKQAKELEKKIPDNLKALVTMLAIYKARQSND